MSNVVSPYCFNPLIIYQKKLIFLTILRELYD
ncbi:hypothetical protein CY0110_15857 [Crocosphaera chwakensis CCY0110]|uniref:Uncharacterized protein n=1 Tax=Crocosphaera chwakensis CCY0110 TaxID=391612 RepID=A3IHK3_9CHRO|nr:hypothetical protein CY0110_15857 [Crocosphaera chwakensis CCY0110]